VYPSPRPPFSTGLQKKANISQDQIKFDVRWFVNPRYGPD